MNNDFSIIAQWYLSYLIFQFIGLGFLQPFFKIWKDKGYSIARFVGLLIAAMPLWLLSTFKIIVFSNVTVVIFTFLSLIASIYLLKKYKFKMNKMMFIEECMFLFIFIIWTLIRSTNSRIEGTEKMMNLAFMNAINRTDYFPPNDPWYSGFTINYYYLGHYIFTFFSKLAFAPISYGYNLALNTIIAQTFIGTVGIISEITSQFKKKRKSVNLWFPALIATWLCFGGNLHYLYKVIEAFVTKTSFDYWFPDGTRIIPFVIDEFPAYSVSLGDLHGHYLGMPFVTLFIAILYTSFQIKISTKEKIKFNLIVSTFLFTLFGINSWDFLTVNFLFILLHFYQAITLNVPLKQKIKHFLLAEASLVIQMLPLLLIFLYAFAPAVSGLGFVPLNTHRELLPYLQMWGMFLIITILGIITVFIIKNTVKSKFDKEVKSLVKNNHNIIFTALLLFAVACLLIGVEVLFVKDIFYGANPDFFRTNTVFKFYFAAWNIWTIACGLIIYYIYTAIYNHPWKLAFPYLIFVTVILLVLFTGSIAYIFEGINDFYSFGKFADGKNFSIERVLNGEKPTLYRTIDGYQYIKDEHPEDYELIQWINKNIQGSPVIVETVGEAYTYYARISANTGLTSVLGWPTHEWQWRNIVNEIYKRKDDIRDIYTTQNDGYFVDLIKKYKVNYIVVGELEKEDYEVINTQLIEKYFKVVYKVGNTTLYELENIRFD